MNDIQVIGSHNSYKEPIAPAEMATLRKSNPKAATLDYSHPPLTETARQPTWNWTSSTTRRAAAMRTRWAAR